MITLTERAAKHVEKTLSRRGKGAGRKLGVKHLGCSGLAYRIEWADDVKPEDLKFESHGVAVYVDASSLIMAGIGYNGGFGMNITADGAGFYQGFFERIYSIVRFFAEI